MGLSQKGSFVNLIADGPTIISCYPLQFGSIHGVEFDIYFERKSDGRTMD
jgi:hypothetical protein